MFSVPGSWFLVPGSWFLVLGSSFLVLGCRLLVPGSRFAVSQVLRFPDSCWLAAWLARAGEPGSFRTRTRPWEP